MEKQSSRNRKKWIPRTPPLLPRRVSVTVISLFLVIITSVVFTAELSPTLNDGKSHISLFPDQNTCLLYRPVARLGYIGFTLTHVIYISSHLINVPTLLARLRQLYHHRLRCMYYFEHCEELSKLNRHISQLHILSPSFQLLLTFCVEDISRIPNWASLKAFHC